MSFIRFDHVTFGYSEVLFKDISLSINQNEKIGVVGNNGAGKSSFLNCIAGLLEPQEGRIICPKNLKFGFIEQSIPKAIFNQSLYDVISDAMPTHDKDSMGWKVDMTLDMFKAPDSIRNKPIQALSGGWQRLALIARTVLSNPDILLLDEPTNDLDVDKIMVLENWLNNQIYDTPIVCISHDRGFLENCSNKTFILRGTEIHEFQYSYSKAIELLQENDRSLATQIAKEAKEINRLKRSAHELRQIGVNNYSASALKKSIQIAKRASQIEENLPDVYVEREKGYLLI